VCGESVKSAEDKPFTVESTTLSHMDLRTDAH
jgi:hypothetical protein